MADQNHSAASGRRTFLKQSAAIGITAPLFARDLISSPPSRQVRHASFGAAGMAHADYSSLSAHPDLKLVCVAEVDKSRLDVLKKRFPDSAIKVYADWRELLDKEAKNLDSVNVSTPDHMHAPIAMSAMQRGLNAYVQKPLAHDLYEIRRLTEFAREKKLITQMGIQCHSSAVYRIGVLTIHAGAIGKVKEVHTWSSKKWGDSAPLPEKGDPIPENLNWDLWLGVCAKRPFIGNGYYHPSNWRKRLDFGTGTFGDMGCHIFDPVCAALELTSPVSVRSEGPAPSKWNWAIDADIHYVFPRTKHAAGDTIPIHWYDGDRRPAKEIQSLVDGKIPSQGSIFIGTEGVMLLPHWSRPVLFPVAKFKDYALPRDAGTDHYKQFVNAVLGTDKTSTPFDYAGPLTESVILGGVATRFPKTTLEWDSTRLAFKNCDEANKLIRRDYREGWKVNGL